MENTENKLKQIASLLKTVNSKTAEVDDAGRGKGWAECEEYFMGELYKTLTLDDVRTNYSYAFSRTNYDDMPWFEKPIKPPKYCEKMFYYYYGAGLPNVDLSSVGDTNENSQSLFGYSKLVTIRDVGLPAMSKYTNTFYKCHDLQTIEAMRVHTSTTYNNTFFECYELRDIAFKGTIGTSIDFSHSFYLTLKSIVNIIEHLSNTSKATLTLNTSAVNKIKTRFPYTSPETKKTYNSWDELKASKSTWTITTSSVA